MTAYLLNLIDLAFTLYALSHGARELNPLMQSVPIMIVYKIFVVGLLCYLLKRLKARNALKFCAAVFAALNLWHVVNLYLWRY